jgi:hypothetical protein
MVYAVGLIRDVGGLFVSLVVLKVPVVHKIVLCNPVFPDSGAASDGTNYATSSAQATVY